MPEGEGSTPRVEIPPTEVKAQLMAMPTRDRLGILINHTIGTNDATKSASLIGKAREANAFTEGGHLARLAQKKVVEQDGQQIELPSVLGLADAYKPADTDFAAQSEGLQSVVTILEAMAIPQADGTPTDKDAAFALDVMDENLRIAVENQEYTRTEWQTKLQAATQEERTQLEAQGVWKFVSTEPADYAVEQQALEQEKSPRETDQIIEDEINRLTKTLKETKEAKKPTHDLEKQLMIMNITSLAKGELGYILKAAILQRAQENENTTITDDEVMTMLEPLVRQGQIKLDEKGNVDIGDTLKQLREDDSLRNAFKKHKGNIDEILQDSNLVIYGEAGRQFTEKFFGTRPKEDAFNELKQMLDPHNADLLKRYAEKGALGMLLVLLSMGQDLVGDIDPIAQAA